MADTPEQILDQTKADSKAETAKAVQLGEVISTDNNHALILFGGAAILLIATGMISYWIPEFRQIVISNVGVLVGAVVMYLKGK
ncbi:MAG: hypothetical protein ABFC98_05975 [Candidatus Cloacimonas sp.]